ncbi:exopolyphosphatase [Nitrosomonas supralitoralis]|uniref:Exopolyphosphatase n=1 Tax=Nitrosomonas supralitoralis TaxID=2116706 RepID=A0A2P7NZM1_9PROT|nr:exopolyphosphatase [Nitrosomonas supralitoralis]PSJ18923.1 exopolyphosphatase [Nitrosomonas supralitoralis]
MDESYAAVDLGSNSFHMIVASQVDGRLQIIDRMKEMVRLASGLNDKQELSKESMQLALECLQRFGQRIQEIPHLNVRAVGTNTLRLARNGNVFLSQAHSALGHPVEIIAGREEARLIYLGVAHSLYDEANKRLVIDIGGGSTELVIGQGFDTYATESLHMGCVNIGQRFFDDGKIKAKKMRKAVLFAMQELESIETAYKKTGWDSALGSSGTIIAVRDVVQAKGWCDSGITLSALTKLMETLIEIGDSSSIDFAGVPERRKPVFASGVAILYGVFEALNLEQINVSEGALREGLLYDLIGRMHNEDIRDKTIEVVAQRYCIDMEQANRVKVTAERFFHQIKADWELDEKTDLKLLVWGALIHEVGLSVAHSQYHRHGAYLTANSDMAGFSRQEQIKLAMLIRSHRRKFPLEEFESLTISMKTSVIRLCVLLRLAVVLHRSRSNNDLPEIHIKVNKNRITLDFPSDWLDQHPLTLADLNTEQGLLQNTDMKLVFS